VYILYKQEENMKTLFDVTKLGKITLKNRFIRVAIHEKLPGGQIDDNICETYKNLAQGGIGTIVTGFTLVDETEKQFL
jgi:2,4-dienoyl-CoA reductase-like NADH-dependent reductase (Old Yellow Enzyme family)